MLGSGHYLWGGRLVNGGGGGDKRRFTLINTGGQKRFNLEKGRGGVKNVFELKYHV